MATLRTLLLVVGAVQVAARLPRVTKTGAWALTSNYHYFLDAGLAEAVADCAGPEAKDILDIGAGKGMYVRYYRARGISGARGKDGALGINNLTDGMIEQADLTLPWPVTSSGRCDGASDTGAPP